MRTPLVPASGTAPRRDMPPATSPTAVAVLLLPLLLQLSPAVAVDCPKTSVHGIVRA